jgi:hypothetical protein
MITVPEMEFACKNVPMSHTVFGMIDIQTLHCNIVDGHPKALPVLKYSTHSSTVGWLASIPPMRSLPTRVDLFAVCTEERETGRPQIASHPLVYPSGWVNGLKHDSGLQRDSSEGNQISQTQTQPDDDLLQCRRTN